ncbi:hypothetical protein ACETU7_21385 [Rhodococcus sp. 3Y1]
MNLSSRLHALVVTRVALVAEHQPEERRSPQRELDVGDCEFGKICRR